VNRHKPEKIKALSLYPIALSPQSEFTMNKKIIGCCALSLALLAGCTDLVISDPAPNANADGFVYSLPMGQIYIQAARSKVTQADVDKAKKAADDAQQTADKDATDLTAAQTAKDTAKTASVQAQQKQDQANLKQAQATLASLTVGDLNETVSLTVLPVVADPSARYIGNLAHNWTRDDNMKLSIVKGLLNTSTVTSTDQTPNIIVTLADTAITFATGLPLHGLALAPASPCDAFSYAWIFDPFDTTTVGKINTQLAAKQASFHVDVNSGTPPPENAPPPQTRPTSVAGLVYRTATPVVIRIVKNDQDTASQTVQTTQDTSVHDAPAQAAAPASGASAPTVANNPPGDAPHPTGTQAQEADAKKDAKNGAPIAVTCALASSPPAQAWQTIVPDTRTQYVVSSKAGAFTTTTLTFGFSDGMFTDYTMQRPSEIAAVAGIPVRIASDIMTIPTQLLQLKVNYDTASVARINGDASAKSAQIQQTATLANAETAVVTAQTALASARIGEPTSIANAQAVLVKALDQLRAARATAASNSAAASAP
jgi:hypothetical protein